MNLDWTTVVTGAIGAFVIGIANGVALVVANRYTVRFLDKMERRSEAKSRKQEDARAPR